MRTILILFLTFNFNILFSQLYVIVENDTTEYANRKEYASKNESKAGYWIIKNTNGNIESEGLYVNDEKEGIWKEYFSNGNIKNQINYNNGTADGYAIMYYENGNISEEGTWRNRTWIGDYKYYYENGNPAYIWKYNENGKRTGIQQYFYENGKKMIEGEWVEGKETGVIKEYYENGSLKAEKTFMDGKIDVQNIKKYEQTTPKQQSLDFFDGDGYYKTLNKWRKVEYEGVWKGGKFMDGQKYIYDETGKYIKTDVYRNGIRVGDKVEENIK
jgi:antitoxin component YwqK of YwqJK toxin-antitoxin module